MTNHLKGGTYGEREVCKHCGSKDVFWQRVRGEWVLNNKSDLSRHQCRDNNNRNTEGFDDVA